MATVEVRGHAIEVAWLAEPTALPTLVFLHEGLGSALQWRDFPAELARSLGCGALAYSRRGYGGSQPLPGPWPASFLHDEAVLLPEMLAAAKVVTPPVLFGHSDGASIALVAAAAGLPVRALVIEAPHVFVEEKTVTSIAAASAAYPGALAGRLRKWHGEQTDATFRAWADVWLSAEFRAFNLEALLPRISVPTLVIQGEDDEYGTLAQVDAIARLAPGPVETLALPRCGHTPHRDQRAATLDAARSFITRVLKGVASLPIKSGRP